MRTMLLDDGDLVVGVSSDYQMVTGSRKVQQDVRCALLEPISNDRFHPGWGSSLTVYVGLPADEYLRLSVLGEVNRVITNYALVQRDRVESDAIAGDEARYTTDEIVAGVTAVTVTPMLDTFQVSISISTVSGETVSLSEAL